MIMMKTNVVDDDSAPPPYGSETLEARIRI